MYQHDVQAGFTHQLAEPLAAGLVLGEGKRELLGKAPDRV
jgi:hypothetical protein